MNNSRVVKKIMRMKIRRDRTIGKLFVIQRNYLVKVLEKYGMLDTN